MSFETFLPVLSFGTMFAVIMFALVSQKKTLERMDDDSIPKSTLAADQDSHAKPVDV